MAAIKAFVQWFPMSRLATLNGKHHQVAARVFVLAGGVAVLSNAGQKELALRLEQAIASPAR